jgi:hypothetical protein
MKLRYLLLVAGICLMLGDGCRPAQETVSPENSPAKDPNQEYPVSAAHELIGKWRFVYFKKYLQIEGQLPAPPAFDAMELSEPDKILMQSCLSNHEATGTFTVTFGLLSYRFQPPDAPQAIEHKVGCFLANEGKAMIISTDQSELVFFRSNRIFENDIAGSWRADIKGQKQMMHLSKDGDYQIESSAIIGHYRLWPSRLGNAMTVIYKDPPHGAFMAIFLYQLDNDALTLTPIEELKVIAEKAVTWKRQ